MFQKNRSHWCKNTQRISTNLDAFFIFDHPISSYFILCPSIWWPNDMPECQKLGRYVSFPKSAVESETPPLARAASLARLRRLKTQWNTGTLGLLETTVHIRDVSCFGIHYTGLTERSAFGPNPQPNKSITAQVSDKKCFTICRWLENPSDKLLWQCSYMGICNMWLLCVNLLQ